ncbi:hypothetical protein VLK31_06990 [Variovorax sp. H27-G14]|uniref:hypothetical protein n=1 Tax=Variovorax sp. H27-G14 TaxID=3111914 RepID=UPI0038FC298A
MAKLKAPLYVLLHGIQVIGEYAPSGQNRYWRVRIRPHAFFPRVTPRHGGLYVRRSRVLLAAKLGRALTAAEHAHHVDEDVNNEHPDNLVPLSAAEHNRHHKTGFRHTEQAKARITASLRRAHAEGRMPAHVITTRNHLGQIQ